MVNYGLCYYKNGIIEIVDFNKIFKCNSTKIQEIDKFTSIFNDIDEFKLYLLNKNIIKKYDSISKLRIVYSYKFELKEIPIIYNIHNKYLDSISLKTKINQYKEDIEFLERLVEHYKDGVKYNHQYTNISDINCYITDVKNNGGNIFQSSLLDNALYDFFKKATTKKNKNNEYIIDYRKIRDLALFIYRYEETKKLKELKSKVESIDKDLVLDLHQTDDSIESVSSLHNDPDEPYFPPNSDEERRYKEYMEKLSEMNEECFVLSDLEKRYYKKNR